jgi:hypothetical protein
VHRVAGQEDAVIFGEVGADALADLIGGPPVAVLVGELVGCNGLLGGFEDDVRCDLRSIGAAAGIWFDFGELDVEPNQLVFTGNNHQGSG